MATDTPLPVEAGSVITALAMGFGKPKAGGTGSTAFTPMRARHTSSMNTS